MSGPSIKPARLLLRCQPGQVSASIVFLMWGDGRDLRVCRWSGSDGRRCAFGHLLGSERGQSWSAFASSASGGSPASLAILAEQAQQLGFRRRDGALDLLSRHRKLLGQRRQRRAARPEEVGEDVRTLGGFSDHFHFVEPDGVAAQQTGKSRPWTSMGAARCGLRVGDHHLRTAVGASSEPLSGIGALRPTAAGAAQGLRPDSTNRISKATALRIASNGAWWPRRTSATCDRRRPGAAPVQSFQQ